MEDKKSSSILEKPLNKGISKETWKMEEKFVRFHEQIEEIYDLIPSELNAKNPTDLP